MLVDPVLRPADGSLENVGYVGLERDGGFAEFVTVPASNASRIESALTDVELASFPCAYGTAENLLTRANVVQGEVVLVTGASGGVGSAVVQLARLRGARVIAVTTRDKARDVLALGAQQTVERSANLVHALGRESVDVVVDVVGGDAFTGLLDVLKRGGRYAVAGAIAGPVVPLDLRTLYLKDLTSAGMHGDDTGGVCSPGGADPAGCAATGGPSRLPAGRHRPGAIRLPRQGADRQDRAGALSRRSVCATRSTCGSCRH